MDTQLSKSYAFNVNSGFSNSSGDKWGGFIEQSFTKKLSYALFSLTSYIYNVAPKLFLMHDIVSIIRILQIIGPAFFVNYSEYWDQNTNVPSILSIVCVFFHVFPPSVRENIEIPFLIIYIIIFALFFLTSIISAIYYTRYATLPSFIAISIYVVIHTIGYIIHPIAVELIGGIIGRFIVGNLHANNTMLIVLICISLILLIGYAIFLGKISSSSILMRPNSLISLLNTPQRASFFVTFILTFVISLGSNISKIGSVVCVSIGALLYILFFGITIYDGGFIKELEVKMIMASSITGFIECIIFIALKFLNIKASELILFLYFVIFGVSFIVSIFIYNMLRASAINDLDLYEDDQTNINRIKTITKLARLANFGYYYAHPTCVSFKLFRDITQLWPKSAKAWVLFAKFVTIYPEESQTLVYIFRQMNTEHIKGSMAKNAMAEISSILRMREPNISPELKAKIGKVTKGVVVAKHKIRHIWDLVIQGNIADIGNFIGRAYESVEKSKAEYYHLLRQYPNSRFVVRSYSRFVLDVCADHQMFMEWSEKYRLMQRGITVNPDNAHELGLSYYPYLPQTVMNGKPEREYTNTAIESESAIFDVDPDEENAAANYEANLAIKQQISELVIPGTVTVLACRITAFFVCFATSFLLLAIGIFVVTDKYSSSLDLLYHLASLRSYILTIPNFGLQYVLIELGHIKPLDYTSLEPPEALGGSLETKSQLQYLLAKTGEAVQNLKDLHGVSLESESLNSAKNAVYGNKLNYTYFINSNYTYFINTKPKIVESNVQQASLDMMMQLSDLITDPITADVASESRLVNPLINLNSVASDISYALFDITKYVTESTGKLNNEIFVIRVVFSIAFPVYLIIVLIVQIYMRNKSKITIFKCLTLLPKNIVSQVTDSLKTMKGGNSSTISEATSRSEDSELNKQEENMLKVFATASDNSGSKIADDILMIVTTIFTIALAVLMVSHVADAYIAVATGIREAAPHIDYLMGAFAYESLMLTNIYKVASYCKNLKVYGTDPKLLVTELNDLLAASKNYYNKARYGTQDQKVSPFKEFAEGIQRQNSLTNCDVMKVTVPENFHDTYKCLSLEMMYLMVEDLSKSIIEPYHQDTTQTEIVDPNDDTLQNTWIILYNYLYSMFFYPIFDDIVPSVRSSVNFESSNSVYISITFLILELIVEIIVLVANKKNDNHLRFALNLLLHCPPNTVTSTPLISNVLSGNFKGQKGDSSSRDKTFFDDLLVQLPDPLLIVDESGKISSANVGAERMFQGMTLVGADWVDFVNDSAFDGTLKSGLKQKEAEFEVTYKDSSNAIFNLTVHPLAFGQTSSYTFRDITRTVRYNTLIAEERAKSDRLLESILPAKLVKRVQQGEKHISFAVQSASVCFIDIVSFTPWCGSLPAQKVMMILNKLFKEFDALVQAYPTLTKIKCIGDCYMAAAGIFSEISQPAVHAKEMVEFGIACIHAVKSVNAETEQSLQIRVGINTGGPLVAGVLGSGKPTFEILGPTINMAQQMEHHGVPMQVHISRAVYELIYGGNFKVKERGQIEIKNGNVVTYLVSP